MNLGFAQEACQRAVGCEIREAVDENGQQTDWRTDLQKFISFMVQNHKSSREMRSECVGYGGDWGWFSCI
jgi:hypothetical protein